VSGRITDVAGVRVGHAGDDDARTGCTVVLGPFRAGCDIRGGATGTRELEVITRSHLVDRVDAILLTGGGAFGLAAADGVVAWLEDGGHGFDTGPARVPIVPGAVLFDLGVGRSDRRPDAAMGRAACAAAGIDVAEGRVGAGTGATVGKLLGPARAMDGGVGTAAVAHDGFTVGALVAVNALGDVLDRSGRIIAGARDDRGGFADSMRLARTRSGRAPLAPPGTNTTLAVLATDAALDQQALNSLARAGSTAVARRIAPVHTPFDGDVTFAVSTAPRPEPAPPDVLLALGAMAADALAEAIERSVQDSARA